MPTQFPVVIQVSDLNGNNGFVINGISAGDYSGRTVNTAGDINADGIDDLFVGAMHASPNGVHSGQSYVIFGGVSVGNSVILQLSDLNGKDGFKINGITQRDYVGWSIAPAGDINDDGVADIVLGAYNATSNAKAAGQSYVIFGGENIGSSGTIQLSSLNGNNGFTINGIAAGDQSGFSVSSAGDVNGDGVDDLIIGADVASPNGVYSGQSYVVFGGAGICNATVELSSLDGRNGFKLNGISKDNYSGFSVASVYDINNDTLSDVLIGAPQANPNGDESGQSYVIFGSNYVGNISTIELSNLAGILGFNIDGAGANDWSGWSVNSAGDINGDGVSDLIIGAPHAYFKDAMSGNSYIIFGGTHIGESGNIQLSDLNGSNGFVINGISASENGWSVASAGDINGDGVEDVIMGAPAANSNGISSGQSYVIFGSPGVGATGALNIANLNGINGFSINGIEHTYTGCSVASAGDVNNDGITDLIIGAVGASPNGYRSGQSYIVFGDYMGELTLQSNQLSINQGQNVVINQTNLNATSSHYPPEILQFIIHNVQHGQFEYVSNPGVAITQFYQQNLTDAQIQFVQDGSIYPPSYNASAFTGRWVYTTPEAAVIYFGPLILINNQLTISQNENHIFTTENLLAASTNVSNNEIQFKVINPQYGWFEEITTSNILTEFNQQQINNQVIRFIQDGSPHSPSYEIVVSDGYNTLPPLNSNITFYYGPKLVVNSLTIRQGHSVILSENNLQATDLYMPANELIFSMSAISHGRFSLLADPAIILTNFTQEQLNYLTIQFTQDGSRYTPQYNVTVIANNRFSAPSAATVHLITNDITSASHLYRNLLVAFFSTTGLLGSLTTCYVVLGLLKNRYLHAIAKNMEGEQARYYRDDIIPIAQAVFKQIKITSFMNYISADQMEAYVAEIATIVNELNKLGINTELQQMESEQKVELIGEIVKQMKHHLDIQTSKCNRTWFVSFFKPQITPEQIGEKAKIIAESVHNALLGNNIIGSINVPTNLDLTDIIGQAPSEDKFTTGYVQMP